MKVITLVASERPVTCTCYNREGDLVFSGGKDGMIYCWRADTGERVGSYHNIKKDNPLGIPAQGDILSNATMQAVSSIDIQHDSKLLVAACFDCIVVFDALTGALVATTQLQGFINCVQWCKNFGVQDKIAVSIAAGRGLDADTNEVCVFQVSVEWPEAGSTDPKDYVLPKVELTELLRINAGSECTTVLWGPLDQTLIGADVSGNLNVWNSSTGASENFVNSAHKGPITRITLSRDRSVLLSVSTDGWGRLWKTRKLELISDFHAGRPLNSGSISPFLCCTLPKEKQRMHVLLGGGQESSEVTTSSDSGKFFSQLVNMAFKNEVATVLSHFSPINTISWNPNGTSFVTGAEEGKIKIYHLPENFYEDPIYL